MVLLLTLRPVSAAAQFSPGPLSRAHAALEGALQCTTCHSLGTGRKEFRCSSCHQEISERVQSKRGYHGRLMAGSTGDADCTTCHKEHAGRDFELIRWPSSGFRSFDHSTTGYALQGKHKALECRQCHNEKAIAPDERKKILTKDLNESFLGLRTECRSCHIDTHRGQLGSNCTTCHTEDAWKPVVRFDHKLTRFPLTGAHEVVACQKCHTSDETTAATRYTGLNFSECAGCHRDPHQGGFAGNCAGCHSTAGWKVPKNTLLSRFNHSATKFPLAGKHVAVECSSCHRGSNFGAPVAHARCLDCHKDKHDGQFTSRADRGDCASCHAVTESFQRTTFNVSAHMSTKYPLSGKHAAVACRECHAVKDRSVDYHPKSASCGDCHKDVHAGQFLATYANKCESCHTMDGFTPSTFSLARHRQSRFALQGAHAAIACNDCHKQSIRGTAHQYVFNERSCTTCHQDPHNLDLRQAQCETCHTLTAWMPTLAFDHNKTPFPLLGAHRSTTCASCHKPGPSPSGLHVSFSSAKSECSGCHEDIHERQFVGRLAVSGCNSCHSTLQWKPASGFDHSNSDFPLDGAHKKVRCVLCHLPSPRVNGRALLVYRDAPTECKKCH